MTKSRRERQLDRTRLWEWLYYVVFGVVFTLAVFLGASVATLSWLFVASILLGAVVWLVQYRANDELGRLRIVKSWAVVGVFNMLALCVILSWYAMNLLPVAGKVEFGQLTVPFWPVYLLLLLNGLTLIGAGAYFRRQEGQA